MIQWLLPIVMALAGLFKGFDEGMDNIRYGEPMHSGEFVEGVRGHRWHKKYQHWIIMFHDGFVYLSGILTVLLFDYHMLLGGLILAWELCEVGQAIARVKYPVMFDKGIAYERIVFMDCGRWILKGNIVYLFHLFRIILAIGVLNAS